MAARSQRGEPSPPGSRTTLVPGRQVPGRCAPPPASRLESRFSAGLDLPRLFAPAEAAEILRQLGLTEMTECALRTRAYRRQVPFHLNGRRIRFTASDLREIVEGQARRPEPADAAPSPQARQPGTSTVADAARPTTRRRPGAPVDRTPTRRLPTGSSHDEAAQAEAVGRDQPSGPHPVRLAIRGPQVLDSLLRRPRGSAGRRDHADHRAAQGLVARTLRPPDAARRLDRRLGRPCSATSSRRPAPSTSTSSKATSCPSSRDASSAR